LQNHHGGRSKHGEVKTRHNQIHKQPKRLCEALGLVFAQIGSRFRVRNLEGRKQVGYFDQQRWIGVAKNNRTADGLHPVMQVNYFGHFLLTHLLIGTNSFVSSQFHVWL
jgi:hypothetical protein